jgi:hypothetical protein
MIKNFDYRRILWRTMLFVSLWFLLVHPRWLRGNDDAVPRSQWQNFGTFDSQKACESHRAMFIGEQEQETEDLLKNGSACVPDKAEQQGAADKM